MKGGGYMFAIGKHLTREEKRLIQRRRANVIGGCMILALIAVGVILGSEWTW